MYTERSARRALLLAYACDPNRGSECATGWNRVTQTARRYETWVICKAQRYEAPVRAYLAAHPELDTLHFEFLPLSALERTLRRVPGLWYAAYRMWHRRALRLARRLHGEMRFDVVHQVNLCGYREPGYLWRLDAPFVWGPVGGTQNMPWRFLPLMGAWGAVVEGCRTMLNSIQLRTSPRVRRAARAGVVAAANSTVQAHLERALGVDAPVLLETSLTEVHPENADLPRADGPLRLLWCGRCVRRKGLPLLLHALAALPGDCDFRLRIAGAGPQQGRWRRMARRLGLEDRCEWLGWLPRAELARHYRWADLFAFTSLRDTSGTVVLESLSHGLPVVCLSHQGMADIVTPECGFPVPVRNPRQVVDDLCEHVAQAAHDPEGLRGLRRGAIHRAEYYLADRNGDRMEELYARAIRDYTGEAGEPS